MEELLGVDLKEDLVADLVVEFGVDLMADLTADLRVDLGVDLEVDLMVNLTADLTVDLGVDLLVDLTADLTVDLGVDLGVDLMVDLTADLTVDLGVDFGVDFTDDLGKDLGVTGVLYWIDGDFNLRITIFGVSAKIRAICFDGKGVPFGVSADIISLLVLVIFRLAPEEGGVLVLILLPPFILDFCAEVDFGVITLLGCFLGDVILVVFLWGDCLAPLDPDIVDFSIVVMPGLGSLTLVCAEAFSFADLFLAGETSLLFGATPFRFTGDARFLFEDGDDFMLAESRDLERSLDARVDLF